MNSSKLSLGLTLGLAATALVLSSVASSAAFIDYKRLIYLAPPPSYSKAVGLTQAGDGFLYGSLHSQIDSSGALFRIAPDGTDYTVVYSSPTERPSGVIEGGDGRLYGTLAGDSANRISTLFVVDRDGGNFTVLRTFVSDRAQFGVIRDLHDGRWLYGTTGGNGIDDGGSVFKIATDGTGFQTLRRFGGWTQADGFIPGQLTMGMDGFLYGCTAFGGTSSNAGTVYRLRPDGTAYSVLHRFAGGSEGGLPAFEQPLLASSDGFLYGASDGGSRRAGLLFKLNQTGGGYQVIHQFNGEGGTGDSPIGGLAEWCDGALYGATYEGGIDGAGILYRINKDGSGFTPLHIYIDVPNDGDTEGTPRTRLVQGMDGHLYGVTSGGSIGEGTVFRINPLPRLDVRPDKTDVVVSWSACYENYELQQSDDLDSPTSWTPVLQVPETTPAGLQVTLPRGEGSRYFRLSRK